MNWFEDCYFTSQLTDAIEDCRNHPLLTDITSSMTELSFFNDSQPILQKPVHRLALSPVTSQEYSLGQITMVGNSCLWDTPLSSSSSISSCNLVLQQCMDLECPSKTALIYNMENQFSPSTNPTCFQCVQNTCESHHLLCPCKPSYYSSNEPSIYPGFLEELATSSNEMKYWTKVTQIPFIAPLVTSSELLAASIRNYATKMEDSVASLPKYSETLMTNPFDELQEKDLIRCEYPGCIKTFTQRKILKIHFKSHSDIRPYRCQICVRSFSRKHDLHRHIRVHTGEKPYTCKVCRKGFARGDGLKRHYRVESGCKVGLELSQG